MALLRLLHMKLVQKDKHQVHLKCLISTIATLALQPCCVFIALFNSSDLTHFLLDRVLTGSGLLLMEAQKDVYGPTQ